MTHDQIRVRAYFISVERTAGAADPVEDWLEAERQLTAECLPAPRRPSTDVS